MNLKQIQQEFILNHPAAVKTAKSRGQLTLRHIPGIREWAFSISHLFIDNSSYPLQVRAQKSF